MDPVHIDSVDLRRVHDVVQSWIDNNTEVKTHSPRTDSVISVLLGRSRGDKKIIEHACHERDVSKDELAVAKQEIAELKASLEKTENNLKLSKQLMADLKDCSKRFEIQCLQFAMDFTRLAAAWIYTADMSKTLIDEFVKEYEDLLEIRKQFREEVFKIQNMSVSEVPLVEPDAFMKGVQEVTSNLRTLQMTGTKLMRDVKGKFNIKDTKELEQVFSDILARAEIGQDVDEAGIKEAFGVVLNKYSFTGEAPQGPFGFVPVRRPVKKSNDQEPVPDVPRAHFLFSNSPETRRRGRHKKNVLRGCSSLPTLEHMGGKKRLRQPITDDTEPQEVDSEYSEQSTSGRVVGRYSLRDKKAVTIRIDDSDDEDDDESSGDSASTMPVEERPHGVGGKKIKRELMD